MEKREHRPRCAIGYAADERGRGVVYGRLRASRGERVFRCRFRVALRSGLGGREVGYAALAAIAPLIRKQTANVAFEIDDAELIADLTQRRDLPVSLMLPYVRARCALNAFESYALNAAAGANDLTARALAEITIPVAA